MRRSFLKQAAGALLAVATLAGANAAAAQGTETRHQFTTSPILGIGYVANAPTLFRGGGVVLLNPRLVGFFADVKMSGQSPADRGNFEATWTPGHANEFGDWPLTTESSWLTVNGGLTRVVTPELALYGGLGYVRRRAFEEWVDLEGERGEFGYYWVEDERLSGTYLNVLGGALIRGGNRIMFQVGGELLPAGITLGVHYSVPLRR
jgi:hypothetical protein